MSGKTIVGNKEWENEWKNNSGNKEWGNEWENKTEGIKLERRVKKFKWRNIRVG